MFLKILHGWNSNASKRISRFNNFIVFVCIITDSLDLSSDGSFSSHSQLFLLILSTLEVQFALVQILISVPNNFLYLSSLNLQNFWTTFYYFTNQYTFSLVILLSQSIQSSRDIALKPRVLWLWIYFFHSAIFNYRNIYVPHYSIALLLWPLSVSTSIGLGPRPLVRIEGFDDLRRVSQLSLVS